MAASCSSWSIRQQPLQSTFVAYTGPPAQKPKPTKRPGTSLADKTGTTLRRGAGEAPSVQEPPALPAVPPGDTSMVVETGCPELGDPQLPLVSGATCDDAALPELRPTGHAWMFDSSDTDKDRLIDQDCEQDHSGQISQADYGSPYPACQDVGVVSSHLSGAATGHPGRSSTPTISDISTGQVLSGQTEQRGPVAAGGRLPSTALRDRESVSMIPNLDLGLNSRSELDDVGVPSDDGVPDGDAYPRIDSLENPEALESEHETLLKSFNPTRGPKAAQHGYRRRERTQEATDRNDIAASRLREESDEHIASGLVDDDSATTDGPLKEAVSFTIRSISPEVSFMAAIVPRGDRTTLDLGEQFWSSLPAGPDCTVSETNTVGLGSDLWLLSGFMTTRSSGLAPARCHPLRAHDEGTVTSEADDVSVAYRTMGRKRPRPGKESSPIDSEFELEVSDAESEVTAAPPVPGRKRTWTQRKRARLRAYKEQGEEWDWIFRQFPEHTPAAVRTQWCVINK